ncbi:MAG: hypothetical protein FWC93_03765, partial [Defluviitaleaceae bacterium]|nr:hypothetical protein [Defluviitaleaceae bacterium]
MSDYKEKIFDIFRFFTNRLFILAVLVVVVFVLLVIALFDRQIVNGHIAVARVSTFTRRIYTNTPRGEIFDAHGRPLAINIPVFTVMLDPSVALDRTENQPTPNESFMFFMDIMGRHDEEIFVDSEFLISADAPRTFSSSAAAQRRWMLDLHIDEDLVDSGLTADEAYDILLEIFEIPPELSPEEAHTLLLLRTALDLQRFWLHQVLLAADISQHTVAALEEHNQRMPGIYVAFDYLRYYPMGRYVTNIVGYMNRITQHEFETHQELGYRLTDLFGRVGIEQAFELYLRGQRGVATIEFINGRRYGVIESVPPIPGDTIFLTIDSVLQRNIYYILEDYLSTILLGRLRAQPGPFSREILDSMIRANNIDSIAIMAADEDMPASYVIGNFVRSNMENDGDDMSLVRSYLNALIGEAILNGQITVITMLEAMAEQEIIT